jgi:hypothetical protein
MEAGMRRFSVQINPQAFDALVDIALRERRDVRDQAAIILERALSQSAEPRVPLSLPPQAPDPTVREPAHAA